MTVIHIDLEARRKAAKRIIAKVADALTGRGDTALKQNIIDSYCDGKIDQETAMKLIRELGLKHA